MAAVVVSSCLAVGTFHAQSRTNTSGTGGIHQIRGRIHLPNGRTPEEPIRVELQSSNFSTLTVETDRNGGYAFVNLAPGNYTVVVEAGDDFETSREYVTIDTEFPEPPGAFRRPPAPKNITVPTNLEIKRSRPAPPKNQVIDVRWSAIPKEAIERYNNGLALIRRNQPAEAAVELKRSIDVYQGFAPAHAALGKLYLLSGKLDDALSSLEYAVRYDPTDFESHLNYGIGLLNKKDFNKASTELSKASEIDKAAVTPRYYLGLLYVQTHELDRAQQEMESAKKLKGDMRFPLLHRYLGGIYLAKHMNSQAITELETYLSEDPKSKDAARIRETIAELKKNQN
jgi:Tfp pilus assembly protein PilF